MKFLKNSVVLTFVFGMSFSLASAMDLVKIEETLAGWLQGRPVEGVSCMAIGYLAYKAPDSLEKNVLASLAVAKGLKLIPEISRFQFSSMSLGGTLSEHCLRRFHSWMITFVGCYVPIYLACKRWQS